MITCRNLPFMDKHANAFTQLGFDTFYQRRIFFLNPHALYLLNHLKAIDDEKNGYTGR